MKAISTLAFTFLMLTAAASATVFSDDFESYAVDYDIADSADWDNEDNEDEEHIDSVFTIRETSGNKYVISELVARYSYVSAGNVNDSKIEFDFMFADSTENRWVGAIFRLRDSGDSGYVVTCIKDHDCYYGYGDYIHIGVCIGFGESYSLPGIHFLGDYFESDTWYHLEADIYGHPLFTYNVTLDASLNFSNTIDPGSYVVTDGLPGIKSFSVMGTEQGDIYIDNFEIDDDPDFTGIKSASLGGIKASFK